MSRKSDAEILNEHSDERTQCTVFTRVMGYHRPIESFNTGKKGEFAERIHFNEPDGLIRLSSLKPKLKRVGKSIEL